MKDQRPVFPPRIELSARERRVPRHGNYLASELVSAKVYVKVRSRTRRQVRIFCAPQQDEQLRRPLSAAAAVHALEMGQLGLS